MPWRPKKKLWWMIPTSLLLFLILTGGVHYLRFKFTSTTTAPRKVPPLAVAHRGASGRCPENTLVSFKKALEMNAPILELDVHISRNGDLVVMHDPTVDRTTNGTGAIRDLSSDSIRTLDAGAWFSKDFTGEKVPLLSEVFDLAKGRAKVLVELKWDVHGNAYPGLVDKVLDLIVQRGAEQQVILQSFHPDYLAQLDRDARGVEFHQLVFGVSGILPIHYDCSFRWGWFKPVEHARSINIHYLFADRGLIEEQHRAGRTVYAFTLNSTEDIARARNLGVDGVITNYTDRLSRAVE